MLSACQRSLICFHGTHVIIYVRRNSEQKLMSRKVHHGRILFLRGSIYEWVTRHSLTISQYNSERTAMPIGSGCRIVGLTASALFAASVGSTTFILLLRVRAMYNRNFGVTVVFTALWLSGVASAAMLPWALPSGNIGPTDYCIQLQPAPYLVTPIVAAFVNDTLVFIAITRKLMQMSTDAEDEEQRGVMSHLRMFAFPKSLPLFSRVLLRDNQIYYL